MNECWVSRVLYLIQRVTHNAGKVVARNLCRLSNFPLFYGMSLIPDIYFLYSWDALKENVVLA